MNSFWINTRVSDGVQRNKLIPMYIKWWNRIFFAVFIYFEHKALRFGLPFHLTEWSSATPCVIFPKPPRDDFTENYMTPQHKNRSHGGINEFEQPSHLVPSIVDISICWPIWNISKFATRVVWTFVCVCRNLVHAETRRRPWASNHLFLLYNPQTWLIQLQSNDTFRLLWLALWLTRRQR